MNGLLSSKDCDDTRNYLFAIAVVDPQPKEPINVL